jgi:ribose/xylose/arabinose/galactoside ABC-type transport system permease subunit
MPSPHEPARGSFLLRPGEWALVAAILIAIVLTTVVDANHSYWFRPLESLRDIARNTALLGIFALGATVVIVANHQFSYASASAS